MLNTNIGSLTKGTMVAINAKESNIAERVVFRKPILYSY